MVSYCLIILIICCGQGLVVSYCLIILLWSGVGGQLLSYHVGGLYCMSSLEGPFCGAFGKKIDPKVDTLQKSNVDTRIGVLMELPFPNHDFEYPR